MKKSMKFLALFLGFVVLSMFSGCKLWDQVKDAAGPTNKWVSYSWNYDLTVSGTTTPIILDCYLNYVNKDAGYPIVEGSTNATLPKGLTILVAAKKGNYSDNVWQEVLKLFNPNNTSTSSTSIYAYYTFAEGESVTLKEDGSSNTVPFTMNYAEWVIIYNCLVADSSKTDANTVLKTYTKLTDQESLKKLATAYLTQYAITKIAESASGSN